MHLRLVPISLAEADALVVRLHRHHGRVPGHKFSIGVLDGDALVGAAIVGRPVSSHADRYATAEVVRLVTDGTRNACSILYAAAARAAFAMGFVRIQTFILDNEPGTSLKAAGWRFDGMSKGGTWSHRPGRNTPAHLTGPKQRWVKEAA